VGFLVLGDEVSTGGLWIGKIYFWSLIEIVERSGLKNEFGVATKTLESIIIDDDQMIIDGLAEKAVEGAIGAIFAKFSSVYFKKS